MIFSYSDFYYVPFQTEKIILIDLNNYSSAFDRVALDESIQKYFLEIMAHCIKLHYAFHRCMTGLVVFMSHWVNQYLRSQEMFMLAFADGSSREVRKTGSSFVEPECPTGGLTPPLSSPASCTR